MAVKLLLRWNPTLNLIVEQPAGSWAYKQIFLISLAQMFCLPLDNAQVICQFFAGHGIFFFWIIGGNHRYFLLATFSNPRYKVRTYLGLYGHDLPKCSHLLTNMRPIGPASGAVLFPYVSRILHKHNFTSIVVSVRSCSKKRGWGNVVRNLVHYKTVCSTGWRKNGRKFGGKLILLQKMYVQQVETNEREKRI